MAGAALALLLFCNGASAQTLADALSLAYRNNPTLQEARAQQRALDETDPQARVGWRPTLSVNVDDDYEKAFGNPSSSAHSGGATLSLIQPLYTGGRTAAAVDEADATILAGRETLRLSESMVLTSVIQGFADVVENQAILAVRRADLQTLGRIADEIGAKRDVGQISRTDLAQMQAQVALARADVESAEAQLQSSRAEYVAAVGEAPGTLVPPGTLPGLPHDADLAFKMAEAESPTLRQAVLNEQASLAKLAAARAATMPALNANMQLGYIGTPQPLVTAAYGRALSAQLAFTLPLFAGGLNASMVRQDKAMDAASREAVDVARRQVVQSVAQAWNQLVAVRRARAAQVAALAAAELQLTGTQEEYRLALRSTLEVLTADQTVRAIQISIATSDHDELMAEAALLSAVGRLEATRLLPAEPAYDAAGNLKRVQRIGATPYEPLIAGLDRLASRGPGQPPHLSDLPPPASPPSLAPGEPPAADAPLTTGAKATLRTLGGADQAAGTP